MKKPKRRTGDTYYTPDLLARALVRTLPIPHDARVSFLEPHAGGGAFVRALRIEYPAAQITAGDVDPFAPVHWHRYDGFARVDDAASSEWGWSRDWVIGNPPYSAAETEVRRALSIADQGVAFLLRLGFLATARRLPFWREHPPARVYVLAERPTFPGRYEWRDGWPYVPSRGPTDATEYAWFVWDKRGYGSGDAKVEWLSWRGASC